MRGNIIGFDLGTNSGAIAGHDGNRYEFVRLEWRGTGHPRAGNECDFVPEGNKATLIFPISASSNRAGGPAAAVSEPVVGAGVLSTSMGTAALFGQFLLLVISFLLVIPAPWVATGFYRWFVGNLRFPNDQQISFVGRAASMWHVLMLMGLSIYLAFSPVPLLLIVHFLLTGLLQLLLTRWFVGNLASNGQLLPLKFTGDYWSVLGWNLLSGISVLTIIGWAWVMPAAMRWYCSKVEGSDRALICVAKGSDVLWRTLAFALSILLVIPIPWTLRWYGGWWVSQFALVERS